MEGEVSGDKHMSSGLSVSVDTLNQVLEQFIVQPDRRRSVKRVVSVPRGPAPGQEHSPEKHHPRASSQRDKRSSSRSQSPGTASTTVIPSARPLASSPQTTTTTTTTVPRFTPRDDPAAVAMGLLPLEHVGSSGQGCRNIVALSQSSAVAVNSGGTAASQSQHPPWTTPRGQDISAVIHLLQRPAKYVAAPQHDGEPHIVEVFRDVRLVLVSDIAAAESRVGAPPMLTQVVISTSHHPQQGFVRIYRATNAKATFVTASGGGSSSLSPRDTMWAFVLPGSLVAEYIKLEAIWGGDVVSPGGNDAPSMARFRWLYLHEDETRTSQRKVARIIRPLRRAIKDDEVDDNDASLDEDNSSTTAAAPTPPGPPNAPGWIPLPDLPNAGNPSSSPSAAHQLEVKKPVHSADTSMLVAAAASPQEIPRSDPTTDLVSATPKATHANPTPHISSHAVRTKTASLEHSESSVRGQRDATMIMERSALNVTTPATISDDRRSSLRKIIANYAVQRVLSEHATSTDVPFQQQQRSQPSPRDEAKAPAPIPLHQGLPQNVPAVAWSPFSADKDLFASIWQHLCPRGSPTSKEKVPVAFLCAETVRSASQLDVLVDAVRRRPIWMPLTVVSATHTFGFPITGGNTSAPPTPPITVGSWTCVGQSPSWACYSSASSSEHRNQPRSYLLLLRPQCGIVSVRFTESVAAMLAQASPAKAVLPRYADAVELRCVIDVDETLDLLARRSLQRHHDLQPSSSSAVWKAFAAQQPFLWYFPATPFCNTHERELLHDVLTLSPTWDGLCLDDSDDIVAHQRLDDTPRWNRRLVHCAPPTRLGWRSSNATASSADGAYCCPSVQVVVTTEHPLQSIEWDIGGRSDDAASLHGLYFFVKRQKEAWDRASMVFRPPSSTALLISPPPGSPSWASDPLGCIIAALTAARQRRVRSLRLVLPPDLQMALLTPLSGVGSRVAAPLDEQQTMFDSWMDTLALWNEQHHRHHPSSLMPGDASYRLDTVYLHVSHERNLPAVCKNYFTPLPTGGAMMHHSAAQQ